MADITIECLRCKDKPETGNVDDAIAFDRKHRESCPPEQETE